MRIGGGGKVAVVINGKDGGAVFPTFFPLINPNFSNSDSMEADEIQIQCKFPRISGRLLMDGQYPNEEDDRGNTRGSGSSSAVSVGRFCGWPSSRIVRVSRASGGKDRHSKVVTSKGLRDRRVRLSVNTAIQFYDLQDRLGYDQPSKAVEWLLKAAATSIAELPPMNSPFPDTPKQLSDEKRSRSSTAGSDQLGHDSAEADGFGPQQLTTATAKSSACSSNSETSKGSGISLSRSESRMKARERAKERAAEKKELKEIEFESSHHHMNPNSQTFTDLLNGGGINNVAAPIPSNEFLRSSRPWPSLSSPMDYFNSGVGVGQMHPFTTAATFSISGGHNQPQELMQFSLVPENLENGNQSGFNRGTLQSNSSSSMLPHFQRFPDENFSMGADNHYQFLSVQKGKGKK